MFVAILHPIAANSLKSQTIAQRNRYLVKPKNNFLHNHISLTRVSAFDYFDHQASDLKYS